MEVLLPASCLSRVLSKAESNRVPKANLRRLLSHGFFPYELPQVFSSNTLATLASPSTPLAAEFTPANPRSLREASLAKHNLARKGMLRRVLGIPNPVHFFNLAREMVSGWQDIEARLAASTISASKPTPQRTGERALVAENGPPDYPRLRARHRPNFRYLLAADVLQFYPSIYTHAISWALHGKAAAKAARNSVNLLGNRLDLWIQRAQDGQTRGVPIGPDTSRVIGELILAGVDSALGSRVALRGFRALDDYELSFRTRSDAEGALAELQTALGQYELYLNDAKTSTLELPQPLDTAWPQALRDFRLRRGVTQRLVRMTEYFSLAFEIAKQYPTESVLRYAISTVSKRDWGGPFWRTYQDLLLQCATAEPGTLKHVAAEFRKYQADGERIDQDRIAALVENTVSDHVPLGHGSEVAWSLWLSIALGVPLTPAVCGRVSGIDDPLIPLLALHAISRNLNQAPVDTTGWADEMTQDGLYGRNWLLAYEASIKGWLPSRNAGNHVDQDPCFAGLKANGVSFYNARASARHVTRWRRRMTISTLIGYGI